MIAGLSLTFKPQGSSTWCAHGEGGTTSKDLILWFDQSKTAKQHDSRTLHWPFFLFFKFVETGNIWQFYSKELRWVQWARFLSSGPLHDRHCEACIDRDVHFLCDPMPPRSQAQPVSLWKTYFSFAKRGELALFWKHTGDRIRTPRMGYGDMMMPREESSINRVISVKPV